VLNLEPGILAATFAALRHCGGGKRECVAYWLGPTDRPHVVSDVVQIAHQATPRSYTVDSRAVTDLFLSLRATKRSVRAQIHTHPGVSVAHSRTDDCFALAPHAGFVSVVLPNFALGPIGLAGAHATTVTARGWAELNPNEVISWK
jgi:hypothetical protein